jgi:PAS domain S-box-containing protein
MLRLESSAAGPDQTLIQDSKSLQRSLEHFPLLSSIYFLDLEGKVIHTYPDNPDLTGLDMSRQPFFNPSLRPGSVEYSDSFISPLTGKPIITMITRADWGVISASIDLKYLSEILITEYSSERGFIAMTDGKGIVIAHSDPSQSQMNVNIGNLSSVREALEGERGNVQEYVQNMRGLSSYYPVNDGRWAVLVFQPYTGAFGLVDRLQTLTIASLIVLLIVCMALCLTAIRKLLGPLRKMVGETGRVSRGEYDVSIQPEYMEFVELAESFNSMAEAVKSREEELKINEERYRSVFSGNPLPIFVLDTGTAEFLDVNRAALEDYGYTYEEFMGMTALDIRPPEDIEAARERILNVRPERDKVGIWRHRRKDGSVFYVDITSHEIVYLGRRARIAICRDVTLQVEAEEALRENQERLRATLESIGDAIVIIEQNGEIVWANRRAMTTFDLREGDLCYRVFHDEDRHCQVCGMKKTLTDGHVRQEEEGLKVAGGSEAVFLTATAPMYDLDGNVTRVVKSFKDITKLKETERVVRQSLAEKEHLIKEVHHRVKNNLQAVSGLLELQARKSQDPWAKKIIQDSQNRIVSMALIHEKLYEMQPLERIDFGDYVSSVCEHLASIYRVREKGIDLVMSHDHVFLNVDTAIPCGLIVTELISNSFKHAFPAGANGKVEVEVTRSGDNQLMITIRDNGVGMDAPQPTPGDGSLGLKLVQSYVELLSGIMQIDHDDGVCYRIFFKEYEECSPDQL